MIVLAILGLNIPFYIFFYHFLSQLSGSSKYIWIFNLFFHDFVIDLLQRLVVSSSYDDWFFIVLLHRLLLDVG